MEKKYNRLTIAQLIQLGDLVRRDKERWENGNLTIGQAIKIYGEEMQRDVPDSSLRKILVQLGINWVRTPGNNPGIGKQNKILGRLVQVEHLLADLQSRLTKLEDSLGVKQ